MKLQVPWRESGPHTDRLLNAAALGGVGLLALLQLRYAWIVCQSPPHQDDWTFLASLFDASHNGRLLAWFFQPYNGHFLAAASLAFWIDLRYLHLDLSWVRWLCPAICWASALLWFRWLARNRAAGESIAGALLGGGLVIFSLSYWEDFSLAMGFSAYLSALLAGAGFAQLAELFAGGPFNRRAGLRAAACLLGSALTFGSGVAAMAAAICWCVLLLAGWRPGGRIQIPSMLEWLAPSVLGLLMLLSNPGFFSYDWPLREFVYRFCLSLGAASAPLVANAAEPLRESVAFGAGLLLVCLGFRQLLLLPSRKAGDRNHIFGAGLIACGLSTCLALTYSRMFVPPAQLLSSRYSMHFALGLLGLILCLRRQIFAFPLFVSALAVTVLIGGRQELQTAPFRRMAYRQMNELILHLPSVSDDEIREKFFWAGTAEIRSVTQEMERLRLGGFRKTGTTGK